MPARAELDGVHELARATPDRRKLLPRIERALPADFRFRDRRCVPRVCGPELDLIPGCNRRQLSRSPSSGWLSSCHQRSSLEVPARRKTTLDVLQVLKGNLKCGKQEVAFEAIQGVTE